MAVGPLKSVVITYPKETPDSVVQKAKQAILDAGGKITHEYNLIKGFAADVPEEAVNSISALDATYAPNVEEDKVYTINN
ncbi:hypothetical protein VTO42DRAFT_8351 [Malbranchea cinnamomea]